jgi:hypothetical protein
LEGSHRYFSQHSKEVVHTPYKPRAGDLILYETMHGNKCPRINACLIPFLYDNYPSIVTPLVLNPQVKSSGSKGDKARLYFIAQIAAAALNDRHISLWDTLISDPPCHRAELCARIWIAPEETTAINMKKELPWEATLDVASETGLTLGDLVKAVTNTRGMAWRKHCWDGVQRRKFHYEWTTIQDLTSKCNLYRQGPCDVENVCLDFGVSPDLAWDDEPHWSRRGIPWNGVRARVNKKYVAGGELVEFLHRDLVDGWRPLVAGLHSHLRKVVGKEDRDLGVNDVDTM